jgi:hypothetical protein
MTRQHRLSREPTVMSKPNPTPAATGQRQETLQRLRNAIHTWLEGHDPKTAQLLRTHPCGSQALDEAAEALARQLDRAEVVLADPTSLDRSRGDEIYLLLKGAPEGLEAALVANLAGDQGYWTAVLGLIPMRPPSMAEIWDQTDRDE